MNPSTPGHPVHHQLLEFTQIHVHRVGDVIQPSHPLSSPFLPAPIPPSIRVFSNESTLIVFILLQIKLGLQVSHCALKKKSQQFYSDHEEGTQSGLLAFALPLLRTGALVPAEASCVHLPP